MKILIVDDHPLVRKGICSILAMDPSYEIIGEAENILKAMDILSKKNPDLVIIDLRLKNESGLELLKKVRKSYLMCKLVILTSSTDQEDFIQAEQLGIDGYILKEALPDEFLYALNIIFRGRKYYDPIMIDAVVKGNDTEVVDKLTPRERDVLDALGKGMKNCDIARQLYITEYTVKKHVGQILDKLGLDDRTQAALYANNLSVHRN